MWRAGTWAGQGAALERAGVPERLGDAREVWARQGASAGVMVSGQGPVAGSGERSGHVCETLHVASLTDTCRFLGWSLQTELSIQAQLPVCPPSRPRWPDWALGGGQAVWPQPLAT